ncbi:unnamed protein product, partial [Choristocarpus tenellus]
MYVLFPCRACSSILSRDRGRKGRSFNSLQCDPGLQQLLPHFCNFIQAKV